MTGIRIFTAVAAMLWAFGAQAQETSPPAAETAAPQAATPTEQVTAVHGDWQIACLENECAMRSFGTTLVDARIPLDRIEVPDDWAAQSFDAEALAAAKASIESREGRGDIVFIERPGVGRSNFGVSDGAIYLRAAEELGLETLSGKLRQTIVRAEVVLVGQDQVAAGFLITTPLKSLLAEGVVIQIDNNSQQKYPYMWCDAVGCYARFGVTQGGLDAFRRGAKARITLVSIDRPNAPVVVDLSLSGFTAAFKELSGQ